MKRTFNYLLALLVLAAPARASVVQVTSGELESWTETEHQAPPFAYASVWVELRNRGAKAREVTLTYRSYQAGRVTRSLAVEPGERLVAHLPVPASLGSGEIRVHPRGLAEESTSVVLLAQNDGVSVVLGNQKQLEDFAGPDPSSASERRFVAYFDALHLPDLVASYLGRRTVLLLDPSAASLSRAQRQALEQYALLGGEVVFAGPAVDGHVALETWCAGEGIGIERSTNYGFGSVFVCRGKCETQLDDTRWKPGHARAQATGLNPTYGAAAGFNAIDDVELMPEVGHPPVGVFLLIILLFALAIGPGNILVARKWGRHMVLVTIPALAFATCTGIAGYGVAADGLFTVHLAARSATILDASQNRAATLSVQSVFAALAPGRLEYPAGSAALFVEGEETNVELDWTRAPSYGGFVASRTLREVALESVLPTRARISGTIERPFNSLGGRIVRGRAMLGGKVFGFREVPDGAPITLESSEVPEAAEILKPLSGRISFAALDRLDATLGEGEYLVEVESGAFVPTGGLVPNWHASSHVVRGTVVP